jgi:hypothetical protein
MRFSTEQFRPLFALLGMTLAYEGIPRSRVGGNERARLADVGFFAMLVGRVCDKRDRKG